MLGRRELRELVAMAAQHMVDESIQEGENKLAELKRRLTTSYVALQLGGRASHRGRCMVAYSTAPLLLEALNLV